MTDSLQDPHYRIVDISIRYESGIATRTPSMNLPYLLIQADRYLLITISKYGLGETWGKVLIPASFKQLLEVWDSGFQMTETVQKDPLKMQSGQ